MKSAEKDIEVVVLHFGSSESSQAASMILVRRGGDPCATKAAAIRSVARFFYAKWSRDNAPQKPKKCCATAKPKPGEDLFCKKCSRSLSEPLFDHRSYTDWLLQQPSQTASDWGDFKGEWWPWNTLALISHHWKEGVGCMEVGVGAEKILTWALDPEAKWLPEAYRSTIRELQAQELGSHDDVDDLIEESTKTFDELIELRLGVVS